MNSDNNRLISRRSARKRSLSYRPKETEYNKEKWQRVVEKSKDQQSELNNSDLWLAEMAMPGDPADPQALCGTSSRRHAEDSGRGGPQHQHQGSASSTALPGDSGGSGTCWRAELTSLLDAHGPQQKAVSSKRYAGDSGRDGPQHQGSASSTTLPGDSGGYRTCWRAELGSLLDAGSPPQKAVRSSVNGNPCAHIKATGEPHVMSAKVSLSERSVCDSMKETITDHSHLGHSSVDGSHQGHSSVLTNGSEEGPAETVSENWNLSGDADLFAESFTDDIATNRTAQLSEGNTQSQNKKQTSIGSSDGEDIQERHGVSAGTSDTVVCHRAEQGGVSFLGHTICAESAHQANMNTTLTHAESADFEETWRTSAAVSPTPESRLKGTGVHLNSLRTSTPKAPRKKTEQVQTSEPHYQRGSSPQTSETPTGKMQRSVEANQSLTARPEGSFAQLDRGTLNTAKHEGSSLKDRLKNRLLHNASKPCVGGGGEVEEVQREGVARALMDASQIRREGLEHGIGPFFGLPSKVQELLAKNRKITKLYDWQEACLGCAALRQGRNLVYTLPTSGGKTLVAEILILQQLLCKGKNCLLVLPYISIVQEKVRVLSEFATELGFLVEEYAGSKGRFPPTRRRHKRSLYVATIEKAQSLANSLLENSRLSEIGLVVVDELHMIGEGGSRGAAMESCLLKLLHTPHEPPQVIGMSATLNNISDLANFLNADVFSSDFRPVSLTEYVKVEENMFHVNTDALVPEDSLQHHKMITFPGGGHEDPDHLLSLVMEVLPDHSCLLFCPTKRHCQSLATMLATRMARHHRHLGSINRDKRRALLQELHRDGGGKVCPTLRQTLQYGIAYHHSGLTTDERRLIEDAYSDGVLCLLTCTSTLAAGVNLPAHRVILRSPYVGADFISHTQYKQMSGRAGRAGIDASGESILIAKKADVPKVVEMLTGPRDLCHSSLMYQAGRGLQSLILSLIGLKVVESVADVYSLLGKSLLSLQAETLGVDVTQATRAALQHLTSHRLIQLRKMTTPTPSHHSPAPPQPDATGKTEMQDEKPLHTSHPPPPHPLQIHPTPHPSHFHHHHHHPDHPHSSPPHLHPTPYPRLMKDAAAFTQPEEDLEFSENSDLGQEWAGVGSCDSDVAENPGPGSEENLDCGSQQNPARTRGKNPVPGVARRTESAIPKHQCSSAQEKLNSRVSKNQQCALPKSAGSQMVPCDSQDLFEGGTLPKTCCGTMARGAGGGGEFSGESGGGIDGGGVGDSDDGVDGGGGELCSLEVTGLGKATFKGSIDLAFSSRLYDDLKQGEQSLVLANHLHLLYLVTPYDLGHDLSPCWMTYLHQLGTFTGDELKVASLIGITESYIAHRASGRHTRQKVPKAVVQRFYLTLMLYELWKQFSVWEVAERFSVTRGFIQNLLSSAAAFSSCVLRFCQEMPELWPYQELLVNFSQRLAYCVTSELLPLVEVPGVKMGRARQLYSAGYRSLQSLASAEPNDLVKEVQFLTHKAARQIVSAAKVILEEKADVLLEQVEQLVPVPPTPHL